MNTQRQSSGNLEVVSLANFKLGLQDEKVHLQTFKKELRAEKVSLHLRWDRPIAFKTINKNLSIRAEIS